MTIPNLDSSRELAKGSLSPPVVRPVGERLRLEERQRVALERTDAFLHVPTGADLGEFDDELDRTNGIDEPWVLVENVDRSTFFGLGDFEPADN